MQITIEKSKKRMNAFEQRKKKYSQELKMLEKDEAASDEQLLKLDALFGS